LRWFPDIRTVIQKLQAIHLAVDDISSKAKELTLSDYEPSLGAFSPSVDKLVTGYSKEYDQYRLDEIVVAAIAPTVSTSSLMIYLVPLTGL
jgi:tuftelin-interacting protein 11